MQELLKRMGNLGVFQNLWYPKQSPNLVIVIGVVLLG